MESVDQSKLSMNSRALLKKLAMQAGILPLEIQEMLDECFLMGVEKAEDYLEGNRESTYDEGYSRGYDDGEEAGYEAGRLTRSESGSD